MPQIQIDLKDELFSSISQRFPDIEDRESVVKAIVKIATLEWSNWMNAEFRPNSLSELAIKRIESIYQEPALYAGKRITKSVLFNQFNLPYGQSSYIERVYSEKNQPSYILTTLESILTPLKAEFTEWSGQEDRIEDQSFTIRVNSLGDRILQSIMQKIIDQGNLIAPKINSLAVKGNHIYTIVSQEVSLLIDELELFKSQISHE